MDEPGAGPIRVFIVDDLAVVRTGLKLWLKAFDDLTLVGEAANGNEAVLYCQHSQPDVVLMDLDMPGLCSVAATRLIRFYSPATQVIAMSSFEGQRMQQKMLDNGAIRCLLKNISSEELVEAIRRAHRASRPAGEAIEPVFNPLPNVPCKGDGCPWNWHCRPADL